MAEITIDARMINHTGIGRYVSNLLKNLKEVKGIENHKFSMLAVDEIPEKEFTQFKINSKIFSLNEQLELPVKIARSHIDLLHSPQFNIPLLSRTPQVTTIHDCAYDRFPEEFTSYKAKAYYKFMFPMALQKSKRIIAVSESTKRDLIEFYKITPEKISVIYEGVDNKFFQIGSDEDINILRNELNISGDFALYVGLSRPRKNLERSLRAFAKILPSLKDSVKFVLAGKVDNRFLDVKKLAEQLNIDHCVVQLGFVPDDRLLLLYKAAAFLMLPSLYEGFGLPVLESMASGTPVITSNISSLPEVAGDAAILVNPYNVDEIAQAMYDLFTNTSLRETLRHKGRERAQKFTWKICAEKHLAVYEEVLNGK